MTVIELLDELIQLMLLTVDERREKADELTDLLDTVTDKITEGQDLLEQTNSLMEQVIENREMIISLHDNDATYKAQIENLRSLLAQIPCDPPE